MKDRLGKREPQPHANQSEAPDAPPRRPVHERLGPREPQYNRQQYTTNSQQYEYEQYEQEAYGQERQEPEFGRGGGGRYRGRGGGGGGGGRRPPPLVAPEQHDPFQRGAAAQALNQTRAWNQPTRKPGDVSDPTSPLPLPTQGGDWVDMLGMYCTLVQYLYLYFYSPMLCQLFGIWSWN